MSDIFEISWWTYPHSSRYDKIVIGTKTRRESGKQIDAMAYCTSIMPFSDCYVYNVVETKHDTHVYDYGVDVQIIFVDCVALNRKLLKQQ